MKTQIQTRIGLAMGLTLALLGGLAPRAEAAGYQMPITFGGYTNRTVALTNFPVLVVFSNGVGSSGFTFASMPFATTNGYDLRFRDASGAGLNYEIESWNTNSASYVWVQIPTIATNGSTAITATWGDAARSYQMPYTTNGAVWANGYEAVWHLKDGTTLGTVKDSTTNGYTATINGTVTAVTGRVDGAADFNGAVGSYLNTTFNPQARLGNNLTIRALVYPRTGTDATYRGVAGDHGSQQGLVFLQYDGSPSWLCSAGLGAAGWANGAAVSLALNSWNDVSAVYMNSGGNEVITSYKDGVQQNQGSKAGNINHLTTFTIGRAYNGNDRYFNGIVDELRVSSVARSADWVWAEYLTMASNTLFSTYGAAGAASSATYQLPIAFTNYTRAETLSNFPVLVVLANGLGGSFNYDQFTAPGNGGDLRFTDSTGSANLDFEFEKWDNTGASYAWVRVPQLSSNTTIYAKWGGSDTNLPASTTNGVVWTNGYVGVWHLSEITGQHSDSTANKYNSSSITVAQQGTATGVAGGCDNFNGAGNSVVVSQPVPNISGYATVEAWVNGHQYNDYAGIVCRSSYSADEKAMLRSTSSGKLNFTWNSQFANGTSTFNIPVDTWAYVAGVGDVSSVKAYLNGVGETLTVTAGTTTWTNGLTIGLDPYDTTNRRWIGKIDEVRVSNVARSSNWVWACYANMASNAFFNGYGTATAVGLTLQPVTNVTKTSAQLIATLSGSSADLYAFWDTQDRGTNFTWAYTNSPLNAFANTAAGTTITNTATGLTPGTSYAYRFYGTNTSSGWQGWSAAGSFTSVPASFPPQVENRAPTGVMTNAATFNGCLVTNGSENAGVYVAWGQTNGSGSGAWATTNWWNPGDWTNGSYPSTNMTLSPNANYYYTFGATNSTTNVVASGYQYLITGEVTVQPTDPTGRVTLADSAAFTVYRPASCTNEALTVAYTLGGTATNVTHYTNSPAATVTNGTVTIPAGQTNAVVTVYPLNVLAPQQTVILSLVSSNYPVGAANSATCTLAAVTGYTYNDALNGNWNATSTWNPSTGYPVSNDFAVIDSQTVTANISLTNSTAPAAITVSTGGTVSHGDGVVVASPVTLNGGTWAQGVLNAGSAMRLTGAVTVTTNSLFTGGRGSVGVWLDGPVSGTGRLTFRGVDSYQGDGADFYLTAASNTHSGGIVVEGNYAYLYAVSNQSLGTGDITVNADGRLVFPRTQDYTGAPRTPVVTLATNSSVVQFTTTDSMTMPFGLVAQSGGKLTTEAGRLGEVWSGAVTLNANLTLAAVRASGSGTSMILSGLVSGPGGIVVYAEDAWDGDQGLVELRRGTNTYSGGTTISSGRLKVTADGALGIGPVTVYNTLITGGGSPATRGYRASLLLDATPNMDWTLTNSLAGEGTIWVETGTNRLTAGGMVSPGTNTAAVAILSVTGRLAFAKNGGTPATLAIDVASAGTTPGTHHDQLAVSTGDVTLASSITNCALVVSLVPTPTAMNGLTLTILSAPGADFSSYTFASVTGLGAGGSVVYSNGYVALTWVAQTPVINNGAYSNLQATSCDVSGYLSSTGDTPTVVRCYYGTNSPGESGWMYTNNLGTQAVGTVWTSLTGLTSTVKYHYRFYATNDVGEYWSVATSNFTTLGDINWNDAASGNWNADNANTWGQGTGVYPYRWLNDHVTIDSHTVTITNSLTIAGGTAPADITVATNGTVAHGSGVVVASPVTMAGGTWAQADMSPSAALRLTGPVSVTTNSLFTAKRNAYGIWLDGPVSGTNRLTFRGLDSWPYLEPSFYVTCASNTHSGGMVVESNLVSLVAVSNQCLGTGDIAVNADAYLVFQRTQDYTGAPRTPVVTLATTTSVLRLTTTDNMTLPFGLVAQGAGKLTTEAGRLGEVWSGAITLNTNLTLAAVRAGGSGTSIILSGLISGQGGILVNADDVYNGEQGVVELRRGTNTYAGGTTVSYGRLKVSADGALGTGPVTVYNGLIQSGYTLRTSLLLDATPDMNWTLTNSLAGEGTIWVEGGSGAYALTVLGDVAPGTNTATAGILTVDGDLAFGAGSRLKIDIRGTNGVAGVDYDRLVVDHDLTGLGSATLEINVNTNLAENALAGQELVVVSNATSVVGTFGSVQWNAPWNGTVTYNEPAGTVKLSNIEVLQGTIFKFR